MKYEDFTIHPLADAFPLIQGEAFENFVASIEKHGLREPIVMRDGEVVDGRNRLRACLRLGIEPRTVELGEGDDVTDFILDRNVFSHRHLTPDQVATLVTRAANYVREEARERQRGGQGGVLLPVNSPEAKSDTRDILAKKAGVSAWNVQRALNVRKHDEEHGTNLAEQVEAGALSLKEAVKIAGAPHEVGEEGGRGMTRDEVAQRAERIRELAGNGCTAMQIAATVGLSEQGVKKIAKREGIALPATLKGRRLDAANIFTRTSAQLDALTNSLETVETFASDLDGNENIAQWLESFDSAIAALKRIAKKLRNTPNVEA